jgi:hypothetical protein
MKLQTLVSATLLLVLAPLSPASAQSPTPVVYVFETVDSYDLEPYFNFKVTGILRGEATPRTLQVTPNYSLGPSLETYGSSCERLALIALSKPGQYLFEVRLAPPDNGAYLMGCKLTRR